MMPPLTRVRLATRLLMREWRSGALTTMLMALLIAIISHTAISFFTDRLTRAMEAQATHLLGGDLVLKAPAPADDALLKPVTDHALTMATTQEFSSVVIANDEFLLSSIKAVGNAYPLKGELRTRLAPFGDDITTTQGPAVGEVWVENRVLSALGVNLGDSLTVGESSLRISRIIAFEPDRGSAFYAFSPRVMMHEQDLEPAGLLRPGSRVDYHYLFAGDPDQIAAYRDWLDARLSPGQQLLGIHGERPTVSTALRRAESFMNLAGLVAILLAAVAIAMSARLYAENHFDTSALLRCMGARQNEVMQIFLIQLALLALLAATLGSLIGAGIQALIALLLQDLLPETFPAPGWEPVISGFALSFAVLYGFSLPTLIRLRRVPPLRVLRQNLSPLPLSGRLIYIATLVFVSALVVLYTGNLALSAAAILGGAALALAGFFLVSLLFVLVDRGQRFIPASWRGGLRNLVRRNTETRWQTLAFGTTLMAMALVVLIRTDLLNTWQNQLPDDAPNHFVMNVLPAQVAPFEDFLQQHDIKANPLYPVARGRLTHHNDTPFVDAATKEAPDVAALNRELNLTEAAQPGKDNRVLAGTWWDAPRTNDLPRVSIESQLAGRLGVELGDTLQFFIGGQTLKAQVTSLRSVKWDSFNPNFYMIFEPGSFERLPVTHLTSFHLPADKRALLNDLTRQFPAITLLEVDAILAQIKTILTQVTLAVELVLMFVLAAGFAVTFAALQATLSQRLQEGALLRTLGAERSLIRRTQWVEYAAMGLLSGLVASLGVEAVTAATYLRVFALDYQPNLLMMLLLSGLGAVLIGLFGAMSSRRVLADSPMRILRELG